MGDIAVGDKVVSVDGTPTNVIGVYPQGKKKIYRVTFCDGSFTESCGEHLWLTQTLNQRRRIGRNPNNPNYQATVKELDQIAETIGDSHFIPMVEPVQFEANDDIVIPPYTMGVLLGDGCFRAKTVAITNPDSDIAARVFSELPDSITITGYKNDGKCEHYSLTNTDRNRVGSEGQFVSGDLQIELKRLGLNGTYSDTKFIPGAYLYRSVKDRVALLQGLMDTDGYADKNNCSYYSTSSEALCTGVVELVQSLGGTAKVSTKYPKFTYQGEKKTGKLSYQIGIKLPDEIQPFSLARKAERLIPRKWGKVRRKIVSVDYVGEKEAQCIAVDHPQHLYVTDNYIVTHNTFSGLAVAFRQYQQGKKNILIIAPKQPIVDAWKSAAGKFFGMNVHVLESTSDGGTGHDVVATTYANLAANPALMNRDWDMLIPDEAQYLSSDQAGTVTKALKQFRALARQPGSERQRAQMLNPDLVQQIQNLSDRIESNRKSDDERRWQENAKLETQLNGLLREMDAKVQEQREYLASLSNDQRGRAVFLSATPFAYEKNVVLGQGFLFDWNAGQDGNTGSAYNSGSNFDRFMMQHFGYRMRYNKLTEPEAGVDRGLMQRAFNSWLKSEGALSGRSLESDFDYDRRFVLTESAIGRQVDRALEWVSEQAGSAKTDELKGAFHALSEKLRGSFGYQSRMYFLEALKAREAIPHIQAHLDQGRKVLVMHDFNQGGTNNPFRVDDKSEAGEQFRKEFGDLIKAFDYIGSPIETLAEAFPNALVYNGTVSGKKRVELQDRFNDDTGPDIIVAQGDAMREGVSIHDRNGNKPRVLIHLGMPVKPTSAIQQEGRIYRTGQASDAMFRYLTIGTNWERHAFASKIAGRASTAENLALGEEARGLKESFITAYENADTYQPGFEGEGKGGKEADRSLAKALSPWDMAKALYFATKRQGKGRSAAGREQSDFFATPEPVGLKMVQLADIRANDSVLEPSAGHGAIARWFPENTRNRAIEMTDELSSQLALRFSGDKIIGRFEDHNIVNKYDAIVMNPPFGTGGKLAAEHVAKAIMHLRDGGRIVALIPRGPAADKRFAQLLEDQKDVYQVGEILLPASTFERAGTSVATRIIVLERQSDKDLAASMPSFTRDYSQLENNTELFDRMESLEGTQRSKQAAEETNEGSTTPSAAIENAGPVVTWNAAHTKTGAPLYMARMENKLERDEFKRVSEVAKQYGGYWSRFGKPGFLFTSDDARQQFVDAVSEAPRFSIAKPNNDQVQEWAAGVAERNNLESLSLFLERNGDTLRLDMIKAGSKNQGSGTTAMQEVTEYADRNGLRITLTPGLEDARHGTTSRGRLVEFYKRFGFVENKGRNKDFTIGQSMYREPQAPAFSQRSGATRTRWDQPAVEAEARSIMADWKNPPKLVVVQDESGLPKEIRDEIRRQDADGFVDGVYFRGEVFVVANRMTSPEHIRQVMFHEALGHYGVRQMFGAEFGTRINQLYRQLGGEAGITRLTEKYGIDLRAYQRRGEGMKPETYQRMIADELLAHLAENGEIKPSMIQRLAHEIRKVLRKMFGANAFNLDQMTDVEVLRMVADAARAVREGAIPSLAADGKPAFMVRAEADPAMSSTSDLNGALRSGKLGGVIGKAIDSGRIVLHDKASDMPATAKGAQAVTMPDGKIHLAADMLTADTATGVTLHEAFHSGTEALIGSEAWGKLIGRLGSLYRQGERSRGAAREFWNKAAARVNQAEGVGISMNERQRAEEFGAYAIEEYSNAPASVKRWVDDMLGAVKAWALKTFGIQAGDVTPAQLRSLAAMALRNGLAAEVSGIDTAQQPMFSTRPEDEFTDLNKTQKSMLSKIGRPKLSTSLSQWYDNMTERLALRARQAGVDRYAALLEMDKGVYGEDTLENSIASSSWVLARMSNAAGGALSSMLQYGRIYYDKQNKLIDMQEGTRGLMDVLRQLETPAEIDRFFAWIAANRANLLQKQGRENLFTPDEIAEGMKLSKGKTKAGKNRGILYQNVWQEFQKYRDDVLGIAEATGLLKPGLSAPNAAVALAKKYEAPENILKQLREGRDALEHPGLKPDMLNTAQQRFDKAVEALQDWMQDNLSKGQFDGLNTPKERYDAAMQEYADMQRSQRELWGEEFYVPFYREMDGDNYSGPGGNSGLTRQQAYKRLKGGKQNLHDLLENTMLNFHHLIQASLRNQAGAQAVENAEKMGVARQIPESEKSSKTSTFVMKKGEKVWYDIADPLVFKALNILNDNGLNNPVMKAGRWFKRMFTTLTTTTPQFLVATTIRDNISSMATNPVSFNPVKNFAQGAMTYGDNWNKARMMASGASFSFGHIYGSNPDDLRAGLTRTMRVGEIISDVRMVPRKLKGAWRKLTGAWRKWMDVNNFAENIHRSAIWKQNQERGKLKAAFEARDLVDYSAGGGALLTRMAIDLIPFLNARIQGQDRLYRAGIKPGAKVLTGKGSKADAKAFGRFAAVLGAVSVFGILNYLRNWDDEEYRKLEDWQRDTYWVIRVGDGMFFIPKPFDVGVIANMIERLAEQFVDPAVGGDKFAERLGHALVHTFGVSPTQIQMTKGLYELAVNENTFTGRPIENMAMQRLSPSLRYEHNTLESAKVLSSIMEGTFSVFGDKAADMALSPLQIEHLVRSYLGQVGYYAVAQADTLYRSTVLGETNAARRWYEYQPIRRFYKNTTDADNYTRYGTVFYESLRQAERLNADVNRLVELGELEKARGKVEDNAHTLAMRQVLNRTQRSLSEINREMKRIQRSNMSPQDKRMELDRMRDMRNTMLEAIGKELERQKIQRRTEE
jgi:hypothetical protein